MVAGERPSSSGGGTRGTSWFREQKLLVAQAEREADEELDRLMKGLPDLDCLLPVRPGT